MAASSKEAYNRAYKQFLLFVKSKFPLAPSPTKSIDTEHVVLYIAHCYQKGLAPSSVNTQISAISFINKLAGGPGISNDFVIRKVLQGYEKARKSTDRRLPITPLILKQLIESVAFTCNSNFCRILIKAMYLLAFHAFLRIGEITGSKGKMKNSILRENLTFVGQPEPSALHLTLINFKHSAGKHTPTFVIKASEQPNLCPVRAMKEYCDLRAHLSGPLFSFMDGTPISRKFFSQHLQFSLKWAGLDHTNFKGHSFRIGAATSAAAMGIDEQTIQIMGRWHSSAFRKYIRIPTLALK